MMIESQVEYGETHFSLRHVGPVIKNPSEQAVRRYYHVSQKRGRIFTRHGSMEVQMVTCNLSILEAFSNSLGLLYPILGLWGGWLKHN